jgi:hypothetical protein
LLHGNNCLSETLFSIVNMEQKPCKNINNKRRLFDAETESKKKNLRKIVCLSIYCFVFINVKVK